MVTYTADIIATEFACGTDKISKQVVLMQCDILLRKCLGKIQITRAGFSADAIIPEDTEFRYILVST
jgi:hypothetical protein